MPEQEDALGTHADVASRIISEAWTAQKSLRRSVEQAHAEGRLEETALLYLRQDDIQNGISAAGVHALLALSEAIKIGQPVTINQPDFETPEPEEEEEDPFMEFDLPQFLRSATEVADLFTRKQRPVKDTPQA